MQPGALVTRTRAGIESLERWPALSYDRCFLTATSWPILSPMLLRIAINPVIFISCSFVSWRRKGSCRHAKTSTSASIVPDSGSTRGISTNVANLLSRRASKWALGSARMREVQKRKGLSGKRRANARCRSLCCEYLAMFQMFHVDHNASIEPVLHSIQPQNLEPRIWARSQAKNHSFGQWHEADDDNWWEWLVFLLTEHRTCWVWEHGLR